MVQLLTIILNFRTPQMTLEATEAALRSLEGVEGALTIVDNNSGDGSFKQILTEVQARGWDKGPQQVRVLQSGHNGGFGAGNNFGIRAGLPGGGRPDYVYLLNSDAFPAPEAAKALLDHLQSHPNTGFAGSFIHGPEGEAHHTAFRFPTIAGEFAQAARLGPITRMLHHAVIAPPLPKSSQQVDWLAGASLMMRQSVLDQIGLFDEKFFLYYEETELCWRAAKAGWPTDYVVESRVMHIGSVSTGLKKWRRIPSFWLDSRLYYFTKTKGALYAALTTAGYVLGGGIWRLRALLQRRDFIDPPYFIKDMVKHALCQLRRGARAKPAKRTVI